jgi:hypothetical protein
MEKLQLFYKGENLNIASAKTLCIGPLGTIQRVSKKSDAICAFRATKRAQSALISYS